MSERAPAAAAAVASVAVETQVTPQVAVVTVAAAPSPIAATKATATANATDQRMPTVSRYALPTDALQDVAQGSGLQWVNSDSTKVAAVQAAIAAESKPLHVPRERPAQVSIDAGPLVLVETKRDLRNMSLPFEQPPVA